MGIRNNWAQSSKERLPYDGVLAAPPDPKTACEHGPQAGLRQAAGGPELAGSSTGPELACAETRCLSWRGLRKPETAGETMGRGRREVIKKSAARARRHKKMGET